MTTQEIVDDTIPSFEQFEFLSGSLMEKIIFHEKSLKDWSDVLDVDLSHKEDITSMDIKQKFAEIGTKLQVISYYLSLCSSFNIIIATKIESGKSNLVTELVKDYEDRNAKRPAATVLSHLAEAKYEDSNTQILISRVLKEFWKERRDTLIEIRKCLEHIALAQNMELKYA